MPDNTLAVGVGLAVGSGIGVGLGSVIGALTGDVGTWIVFGVPIGSSIGLCGGIIYAVMTQRARGICQSCGYSTKGLTSSTCPECGVEIEKHTDNA